MTDDQLSDLFRRSAADHLPRGQAELILDAVWNLDTARSTADLVGLLKVNG
jgi:hypothetical protein